MRNDRLIPGMVLVIIGVLFLLNNFNVIDFDWFTFIHLWPIVLIIAGVNLVFAHNRTPLATAIKILVLLAGMGVLIWGGVTHRGYHHFDNNFTFDDGDKDDDFSLGDKDSSSVSKDGVTGNFVEFYKPAIQTVKLNISGGATAYSIADTTGNLFEAITKGRGNNHNLKTTIEGNNEVLTFDMGSRKHHGFNFNFGKRHNNNSADIKLNTRPVWDIDVEGGMAAFNFDLSKYKVKKLSFQGGMASCDVKLGEPVGITEVGFQGGMASFKLKIPKNAACRITTGTALSSKNFEGFTKTADSNYETPGYSQAANKINVDIQGGMSDFKVSRY
jgi:hypothetical protein